MIDQGLEATGLKTKTIVHKSAAPIYAAAVTWVLYALLFPLYQVGHFLLAAAAAAVVALIARIFCKDVTEEVEIPEEPVTTGNPELDKMIADGNGTIQAMRALNDSIQDETISAQIDRLEEVSSRIFQYVKDNPAKLKASTNGNRASNHIGAQVLATSAGFEYTDIPYGGTADQLLALRQGEVDFSVAKVADFASFTSEVKVLAVYNQERLEGYPDVPTMGELGYYDQWLGSSRCIVAPAGTPENVIKFYEDAFQKLMEDADYLKAAEAAGMETDYKNSADTAALIKQQQDFTESLADVWGD